MHKPIPYSYEARMHLILIYSLALCIAARAASFSMDLWVSFIPFIWCHSGGVYQTPWANSSADRKKKLSRMTSHDDSENTGRFPETRCWGVWVRLLSALMCIIYIWVKGSSSCFQKWILEAPEMALSAFYDSFALDCFALGVVGDLSWGRCENCRFSDICENTKPVNFFSGNCRCSRGR